MRYIFFFIVLFNSCSVLFPKEECIDVFQSSKERPSYAGKNIILIDKKVFLKDGVNKLFIDNNSSEDEFSSKTVNEFQKVLNEDSYVKNVKVEDRNINLDSISNEEADYVFIIEDYRITIVSGEKMYSSFINIGNKNYGSVPTGSGSFTVTRLRMKIYDVKNKKILTQYYAKGKHIYTNKKKFIKSSDESAKKCINNIVNFLKTGKKEF